MLTTKLSISFKLGPNKTKFTVGYLTWRVEVDLHREITIELHVPGNTRCLEDAGFGRIKKLISVKSHSIQPFGDRKLVKVQIRLHIFNQKVITPLFKTFIQRKSLLFMSMCILKIKITYILLHEH